MIRKIIIAVAGVFYSLCLPAQQKTISLEEVRTSAINNFPASRQKVLYRKALEVSNQILRSSLMPEVNITGQATYQSEVTKFDLGNSSSAKAPEIKPDQYRAGVEVKYNLSGIDDYKINKQVQEYSTQANILGADISIQHLKEQVNNIYANILYLQQNKSIAQVRIDEINSRIKKVKSAVENGTSLRINLLVLQSDLLSTEQRIDELNAQLLSLTGSMSIITGQPIDTSFVFQIPSSTIADNKSKRPELELFKTQTDLLQLQGELLKQRDKPQVFLFGQGYFGRPGFNFLNNTFRPYALAGIGLSWNINNASNQKRELTLIDINKQQVAEQQNTFDMQFNATIQQERNEILRYRKLIEKDDEIVTARESILRSAASQLENTIITSTEYLTELNALNTAKLNQNMHQVQLLIAEENYKTTLGY